MNTSADTARFSLIEVLDDDYDYAPDFTDDLLLEFDGVHDVSVDDLHQAEQLVANRVGVAQVTAVPTSSRYSGRRWIFCKTSPAPRILRRAAQLLEKRGWTQGAVWRNTAGRAEDPQYPPSSGPISAEGAIILAAEPEPGMESRADGRALVAADKAMSRDLEEGLTAWNDAPNRTIDEVTARMRSIADEIEEEEAHDPGFAQLVDEIAVRLRPILLLDPHRTGVDAVLAEAWQLADPIWQQLTGDDEGGLAAASLDVMAALWPRSEAQPTWWPTPLGRQVAAAIEPFDEPVTHATAAAMLEVTRGTIAQLVHRGTLERHEDGGVSMASVLRRLARDIG